MKIFLILMFVFLIIAPFLYFLYIFYNLHKIPKKLLGFLSFLALIIIVIKILFQPYTQLFNIVTLISEFYIISFFITMLLFAIYHLITHLLHKQIHHYVLIIMSILSLCYSSIGYYSHFHKVQTSYNITIHKESSIDQMKIAMISDVHLGSGTYIQDLKKLSQTLNNQYDIVCLCGDIFDESTPSPTIEEAIKILSTIQTKYGIYAVNGNHEFFSDYNLKELYKKYKINHLQDNYVCIEDIVNIVGREDEFSFQKQSPGYLLSSIDTSLPTIVLDHNPRRYQEVMNDADLQLSGHTHAGQAFPLTLITSALFDIDYGFLEKDNFSLIVSSGYGSWGFPLRILTSCEFVDIMVTFSK